MSDITNLQRYFPRKSFEENVWGYISYHVDHLKRCLENELYESAFFHLHLLYMSFLYIQMVRMAEYAPDDIKTSFTLLDANKETKLIKQLEEKKSPWMFVGRELSENKIPRFFRLAGLSEKDVEVVRKPIQFRNQCMHANGSFACDCNNAFNTRSEEYLEAMNLLLERQKSILIADYKSAVESFDEDAEYVVDDNDIEKYLGTFSEEEQKICSEQCTDQISEYIQNKIKENGDE